MSNLPGKEINDSSIATRLFFENYGTVGQEFRPDDVSTAIGFFQEQGFQDDAAVPTALLVLQKAKAESKPVFEILDTLKKLNGVQLSAVVAKVLNQNRTSSSKVGFRTNIIIPKNIERNIIP
jgi:hypothetical protein